MLAGAGVPITVAPVDLDESMAPGEPPLAYVQRLAAAKAQAGWARRGAGDPEYALGGDTVVVLDDEVLHKPEDEAEARAILAQLSGRGHHVISAWAIVGPTGAVAQAGYARTEVIFKTISPEQIAAYVATGEPMDKAGAYGIQGRGGDFVQSIDGSYAAVVGLPLQQVLEALCGLGRFGHFADEDHRAVALGLATIKGRIRAAAEGVGRDPAEVILVAVSKRQPLSRVQAALDFGVTELGENYVQAWRERLEALPSGPRWHFIGRLQRNKAKYLGEAVGLVHAVDDLPVLEALGKAGEKAGRVLPVMVQVNLSGEASKGGVEAEALAALLQQAEAVAGVEIVGLMTMPAPGDLAAARACFRRLRGLRDQHRAAYPKLSHLSMGMSGDFDVAIAEGATHVRVGSLLFGARG